MTEVRVLLCLLFWLLFCLPTLSDAQAGSTETALRQEALSALLSELQQDYPVSSDLLGQLASAGRGNREALRDSLAKLLDAADRHREQKTDTWKGWLQLRGQLSEREVDKLLRHLVVVARKIVDSDANFALDTSLGWAARKARVPLDQAQPFLLAVLSAEILRDDERVPDAVGSVVAGWTNSYSFSMDPLYFFFDSRDDKLILEEVRDIQRFVVPRAVKVLPEARSVRYAVRKRNISALLLPDYLLLINIDELSFTGSNVDLRPCMETTLELTSNGAESPEWKHVFQFCTEKQGSRTTHRLSGFYDEVALEIRRRLAEYLESK